MFAYLAHEVDSGLGLVEGGGGDVNIEHHLPLAGPDRLVEAKPNLPTTAQRVVVALRTRKEQKVRPLPTVRMIALTVLMDPSRSRPRFGSGSEPFHTEILSVFFKMCEKTT